MQVHFSGQAVAKDKNIKKPQTHTAQGVPAPTAVATSTETSFSWDKNGLTTRTVLRR